MKRILMTAALMITVCNLAAGVGYACSCYSFPDFSVSCSATGEGAECYHDSSGKCVCKPGKGSSFADGEELAF